MKNIHPSSDVQSQNIGDETNIWQFCIILPEAVIGENCNICASVFIENKVMIGNNVTIKPGVQIWDGVSIEDNVFIGPNVTFTNDLIPRSKKKSFHYIKTLVCKGASIGANSTIIAGVEIGEYSFVGAGSVVTKNIPPHTLWCGNPAKQQGYITQEGIILDMYKKDKEGNTHYI